MREIRIGEREAGMRFSNYLKRILPEAPSGFIFKMLRKKNITLNGAKSDGTDKIAAGDSVKLFLADDTMEKFGFRPAEVSPEKESAAEIHGQRVASAAGNVPVQGKPLPELKVLYEDKDVIFFLKPAGLLSQKASPEDISVNECLIDYLIKSGQIERADLKLVRPSVCHRLDRNTSGVIGAGKTAAGLKTLSALLADRRLVKEYLCPAAGKVEKAGMYKAYLTKDHSGNIVSVKAEPPGDIVRTGITPLAYKDGVSLLKIHLVTGKSHQIRAHLAAMGHPVLGDRKYGDEAFNKQFAPELPKYSLMLHSWKITFPDAEDVPENLKGRTVAAPPYDAWRRRGGGCGRLISELLKEAGI